MSRPRRPVVILLSLLLLAIAGSALALIRPGSSPTTSQAQTAIDPRLVLHPTTVALGGTLSGGVPFTGKIYPAIPGPNRLYITLHPRRSTSLRPAGLRVDATMPGMKMSPARATLRSTRQTYAGTIDLAMFGRYELRVTEPGHHVGTAMVTVPLPAR